MIVCGWLLMFLNLFKIIGVFYSFGWVVLWRIMFGRVLLLGVQCWVWNACHSLVDWRCSLWLWWVLFYRLCRTWLLSFWGGLRWGRWVFLLKVGLVVGKGIVRWLCWFFPLVFVFPFLCILAFIFSFQVFCVQSNVVLSLWADFLLIFSSFLVTTVSVFVWPELFIVSPSVVLLLWPILPFFLDLQDKVF